MMAPEDVQIKIQSQTNTVSHRTTAGVFCVGTVVVVVVVLVEEGGVELGVSFQDAQTALQQLEVTLWEERGQSPSNHRRSNSW